MKLRKQQSNYASLIDRCSSRSFGGYGYGYIYNYPSKLTDLWFLLRMSSIPMFRPLYN